jgi:hypothetical protein
VRQARIKYMIINKIKREVLLFLFIFLQFFVYGQSHERSDTVLKYELDTTIVPALPVEEPPAEERYSDDQADEEDENEEYFLRKEFTGGFPDSLKLRKLPDSVKQRFSKDDAFWYVNEVFRKKQPREENGFTSHPVFQTLLWVAIIAGFAIFLMLYLSNSNVGLFRKENKIVNEEDNVDTDDIFAINYQKEIEKAVGTSNYRLAVRLMFLRLLKNLSDRNVIQYKQDSTNFDYLLQMRSTTMYPEFFKLTRNYEYSWYGQFEIDKEKFTLMKVDFDKFDGKIK